MEGRTESVRFQIDLPDRDGLAQDEEWCEVRLGGRRRRIRFHDYGEIYAIPGLYEQLFYEELHCASPTTVCGLLAEELRAEGRDQSELRVLDVGAGNGMVGECLAALGAETLVGVDIIPEAAEAAERDRPGLYDDYLVADLTALSPSERARLARHRFNCMTSVAALGFGDIPPDAFLEAYGLVSMDGWIAFCIKEDFLDDGDGSGFARLVRSMIDGGSLEIRAKRRYRHRLSASGDPLHYVAVVATKRG